MDYKKLPKIELHCHLDGSMRIETLCELGKKNNIDMPTYNPKELVVMFKDMNKPSEDQQNDYEWHRQKFQMSIDILTNKTNMIRAIHELLEDGSKENVKYQEIRFAPRLHIRDDFSLSDILAAFSEGIISGMKKFDIIANGIICFRTSDDRGGIKNVIKSAAQYLDKRIVGIDLVGIETEGFANNFIEEIKYAQDLGFKTTIHSGEMLDNTQNVKNAINLLNTDRIGHGFRIHNDKKQMDLILNTQTHIEICLTSNQKRLKDRNLVYHPFMKFVKLGMKLSLNTDNRTISNTNMTKEITKAFEICGLSMEEYKNIYLDSIEASFASKEEKEKLKKYIL